MCGRYYIDDETAKAIESLVEELDQRQRLKGLGNDIRPTDLAPVICRGNGNLKASFLRFGIPGIQGKGVILNARSESVMEKRMFFSGIRQNRIVVPGTWFYEWNRQKEKNTFLRKDGSILFMAGFFNRFEDGDRFVILTTAANESMVGTHDRMPLILEENQLKDWILDEKKAEYLLHQKPVLLERRAEYEQQTLF